MKLLISIIFVWLLACFTLFAEAPQKDESDSTWSIVMPKAESHDIRMPDCFVGLQRDTLIEDFMKNIGLYKFKVLRVYVQGADASSFNLSSGFPIYEIYPGEKYASEFTFKPNRVGLHTADLIIETQADTLKYKITGYGVQPSVLVVNKTIDFGKVVLGEYRDTIAVTIRNASSANLKITKIKHNLPNDVDFSTLAGGAPLDLSAGAEAVLTLRFKPSELGRTNGLLEFYFDGEGSPADILLLGEGIERKPTIYTNDKVFNDLLCSNQTDYFFPIKNIGNMTLIIESIKKANDNTDFIVENVSNVSIEPDSTKYFKVTFATTKLGTQTTSLEIKSNDKSNPTITKSISATKYNISNKTNVTSVDFGTLAHNESAYRDFILLNNGNKTNHYKIILPANFTATPAELSLDPGRSQSIRVDYLGSPTNIVVNEELMIKDSICSSILIVALKAVVQEQGAAEINLTANPSEDLLCESFGDNFISIKNTGSSKLVITNVVRNGTNPNDFTIIGKTAFTILPSAYDTLFYRFTPTANGLRNVVFSFESNSTLEPIKNIEVNIKKDSWGINLNKSVINLGQIPTNQAKSDSFILTNSGTISTEYSISCPIGLTAIPDNFVLPEGDTKEISVNYSGSNIETDFSANIIITEKHCLENKILPVECRVKNSSIPSVTFTTDDISAYPNETVELPVTISNLSLIHI